MAATATARVILACGLVLTGCSNESRSLGPTPPSSAPRGSDDPRIAHVLGNAYQVSQGGRYFGWYGCTRCHDASVPDLRDARLPSTGDVATIYHAVADGHGGLAYGRRVPPEQLWQLAAYVADLPRHTPEKRKRQSVDQKGEPEGWAWSGPLR